MLARVTRMGNCISVDLLMTSVANYKPDIFAPGEFDSSDDVFRRLDVDGVSDVVPKTARLRSRCESITTLIREEHLHNRGRALGTACKVITLSRRGVVDEIWDLLQLWQQPVVLKFAACLRVVLRVMASRPYGDRLDQRATNSTVQLVPCICRRPALVTWYTTTFVFGKTKRQACACKKNEKC